LYRLLGKWFVETGRRSEIFLATKFGYHNVSGIGDVNKHNSKPSYVRSRFLDALKSLKTDYIDLFYQHRVDPEVPIELVVEALKPFIESGQLKWIGLSEPSIETLRRARSVPGVGEKVIAAQMEFSPFELYVETTGFADVIKEYGMAMVAYSPLARGLVTGRCVMYWGTNKCIKISFLSFSWIVASNLEPISMKKTLDSTLPFLDSRKRTLQKIWKYPRSSQLSARSIMRLRAKSPWPGSWQNIPTVCILFYEVYILHR
jgi:diketogulonate reductase-like aldo/keto reductase